MKLIPGKNWTSWIAMALGAGVIGLVVGLNMQTHQGLPALVAAPITALQEEVWTCAMHPQIRLPQPGPCPICAMDLVPAAAPNQTADLGPRQLALSETAQQLAGLQVAAVTHRPVQVETRMVGKIAYDESRLKHITARVSGRIDRLYVDYTGVTVRPGDHMVYLYSPDLLAAQRELIEALKAIARPEDRILGTALQTTAEATRQKLRLWGLTPQQITTIERNRQPSDHLTIYAPEGGTVVKKHLNEGAYVQTGTRIYTIADLDQVWLELAAYESDLPWIHYDQEVRFTTEAYPGETFSGPISFIAPFLDERSRTVKIRVNVDNTAGRLKPGMFARAQAYAQVTASGHAADPGLAGKWISPMHPEIVRDQAGPCPVCGMDLVPAEELGLAGPLETIQTPLTVPASAVLQTGARAVVYVAVGEKPGVFEGREVTLGPRAGAYYVVRQGLNPGEKVVVNGNFKIDSALQIMGRPSMMNPQGGTPPPPHHHNNHQSPDLGTGTLQESTGPSLAAAFQQQLGALFNAYFHVHQDLSQDTLTASTISTLAQALDQVDINLLEEPARSAWIALHDHLQEDIGHLQTAPHIAPARRAFAHLSETLAELAGHFGPGDQTVYRHYCPMGFDNKGGYWLQPNAGTQNPFFGSAMFDCGSIQGQFAPQPTFKP
ncbi:MAG: DUF3347 domain-containing protein [Candidatus Latescibacteria bacterium]|nr:DUF3347 domain-containing protein [Candidatus Latescibacterota bacterium]